MNQTSDPEVTRKAQGVGDAMVRYDATGETADARRWSEDLEQYAGTHAR